MGRRDAPRRYPRTARVNEVVREVLADELERLSDPRLGFVTLTDVDVSADLRHATVYYSALGRKGAPPTEPEAEATADGLQSATRHLRSVLSREVRLKYLPDLVFRVDPAVIEGQRVEQILRELREGTRPATSDGGDEGNRRD